MDSKRYPEREEKYSVLLLDLSRDYKAHTNSVTRNPLKITEQNIVRPSQGIRLVGKQQEAKTASRDRSRLLPKADHCKKVQRPSQPYGNHVFQRLLRQLSLIQLWQFVADRIDHVDTSSRVLKCRANC